MEGNKHGNASLITSRRVAFTRLAAELKAALPGTARVSFDLDLPIGARELSSHPIDEHRCFRLLRAGTRVIRPGWSG